jgi:hypothetical protein
MIAKNKFKAVAVGALLACAMASSMAAEVAGIKFDDTVKVAGKDLKLNGLGLRTKVIIKVYAAGLYLPEKAKTVADVLKQEGPRRVTLVMMRDVSSDDFGSAFMKGINENIDKTEKTRIVSQLSKIGEVFANLDALKKGDVLTLDWIPGSGSVYTLNGKKALNEPIPDVGFYNDMLKIWLGDKPVDSSLKPQLLGDAR